jgi:CBS-domain-containing membrane protein
MRDSASYAAGSTIADVEMDRRLQRCAERFISSQQTEGRNPLELTAKDCMSQPVVTVMLDTVLEDCCHTMEQNQIRRVPVVDENGACCGVVSQADIARVASEARAGHVLREVSRPAPEPSRVSS